MRADATWVAVSQSRGQVLRWSLSLVLPSTINPPMRALHIHVVGLGGRGQWKGSGRVMRVKGRGGKGREEGRRKEKRRRGGEGRREEGGGREEGGEGGD